MRTSGREMLFWIKCLSGAGILTWVLMRYSLLNNLAQADMRSAAGVVASLSGTMLGLILAALAILASVANTTLIRNMSRTGHFQFLLRRMVVCIAAFGVTTLVGIGMLFVPVISVQHCYVLLGIGFLAMEFLADVCMKFWIVLSNLYPLP